VSTTPVRKPRKILAILLAILVGFSQIPLVPVEVSAQAPAMHSSQRSTGTSFGKGNRGEAQETSARPQILQEQVSVGGLVYQVHILGEVSNPGTYRVAASTRVSEAIQLAGGILERGSSRVIQLRRTGGRGRRVDLVSFKLFGNLDANPYLMDNDVIFVPLREKVVQVEGAVKRPGIYELRNEKTLEDAVKLAGGFSSGVGNPTPIKVVRFDHGAKEIVDVENIPEARRDFPLENADVIVIPHLLTEERKFDYNVARLPGDNELFYPSYDERVFILGAVKTPGPYPFSPYYDARQYLTLAGGTTKLAKTRKIKILTSEGKTIKADAKTEINPGDTIIVPEKSMAPENFATLMIGITASIVGITSAIVTIAK
jgi:protein involved in polysaccharide export with SLBB domain